MAETLKRLRPSKGWCLDAAVLSVSLARAYRRAGHRPAATSYLQRAAMWRRRYQETPR